MSLLLNGNKFQTQSYVFSIDDPTKVGEARRFAFQICAQFKFEEIRQGRIGIVINELGNNLFKYSKNGKLLIRHCPDPDQESIEILSIDSGPGLDPSLVMRDGFSTSGTPGNGLGAVRRQSDEFDILSSFGQGTVIFAKIYAREPSLINDRKFEMGTVHIPHPNETVCGDAWDVEWVNEDLNVIVVDGLGHGSLANQAANEAIEVFKSSSKSNSLEHLMHLIHGRLKSTRGGAVFLSKIKSDFIEFTGVGNIRALVQTVGQSKTLISQNGTAGIQIRTVRSMCQSWDGAGYFILHSDGIASRWNLSSYPGILTRHPSIIAAVLFRDFARGNDDATIVVIRRNK